MKYFILTFIIASISYIIFFILYLRLRDVLADYNKGFTKKFNDSCDLGLMYRTFKKAKKTEEKDILIASMFFYSITFISIVVGIILIFSVEF